MTKLEELKAAWDDAAYDTYATADDAYVAYCEELDKPEENSDD